MESCGFWLDDVTPASTTASYAAPPVNSILKIKVFERVFVPLLDMWILGKTDTTSLREILFNELVEECRPTALGCRLSYQLRSRLDRLSLEERREIVSRVRDGCAPLFMASMRGHVEIIDYLVQVCGADTEQRGVYEVPDDRSVHCVTALWVAAVLGKLNVIKRLVELGADVNAASDSGSTPVRSACFMAHLGVVQYLVSKGADIHKPNINGGTCLINSVESAALCEYLLSHGASVNDYDIQNKTALHYAIQEQRIDTTQVLLKWGADPYARNRLNDDALQIACIKGAVYIFEYLRAVVEYPPERLADAHELMGSTLFDDHNDVMGALHQWKIALKIRHQYGKNGVPLPKLPVMPPKAAFDYATEVMTLEELRDISNDMDALSIQSLLICERVLGEQHKDTVFRLMYRGASYADAHRYQRCINLWRQVVEVRILRDSVLAGDTSFAARAFVKLLVDLTERAMPSMPIPESDEDPEDEYQARYEDVAHVYELLAKEIVAAEKLLKIQPVSERQQEFYNRNFKCLVHLTHLLIYMSRSEKDKENTRRLMRTLLRANPREALSGNSILHLCVTCQELTHTSPINSTRIIFPNLKVVRLLLEYGASIDAPNSVGSTPLLVAAASDSYFSPMIQLLLDHGAHLDQPNHFGKSPLHHISKDSHNSVPLVNYSSLRCLAASAVVRYRLQYRGQIPRFLESFVELHYAGPETLPVT